VKAKILTVTDAARNFADCVNRAHYQHMSFVLLKNGKPVARIEPDTEKRCTGRDLAGALSKVKLSGEDSRAWHKELRAARKTVKSPADKWR
jgi:antitoxin (DNA-binding transcriptional repressor) of toxin-antitoxin stability system